MTQLIHQRCHLHLDREAVARCMECTGYFCRECVNEHGGRLLCTACLRKASGSTLEKKRAGVVLPALRKLAGIIGGVLIAWFCFYSIGRSLASVPSSFHADKLLEMIASQSEEE